MKVAVITGGSRGIGRACVELFAHSGYTVVFTCINHSDMADDVAKTLQNQGCNVEYVAADVSDNEQCRLVISHTLEKYRRIDVLVNNAGICSFSLAQDISPEEWHHVMDVNMTGAFLMCKHALPSMISRCSGSIVNVSSMWGQVGSSCESAYSASKAALIGFTKALAKETAPSGVRVNAVAPGVIDTDMNRRFSPEEMANICEEIPMGRMGTPEETAKAVLFLAGDDAGYITGQVLGVNGGMVV